MSKQHVATYLSDHMAGAVAAVELLERLEKAHAGTPLERILSDLRADIHSDRRELEALIGRLGIEASAGRKAAAWLAETMTEIKMRVDDTPKGPLRLLESVEAVSIGIEGKRLLWRALAVASLDNPQLRGPDYERLGKRAEEQRDRIEPVRLKAVKEALGTAT